jgi:hypothetical protein
MSHHLVEDNKFDHYSESSASSDESTFLSVLPGVPINSIREMDAENVSGVDVIGMNHEIVIFGNGLFVPAKNLSILLLPKIFSFVKKVLHGLPVVILKKNGEKLGKNLWILNTRNNAVLVGSRKALGVAEVFVELIEKMSDFCFESIGAAYCLPNDRFDWAKVVVNRESLLAEEDPAKFGENMVVVFRRGNVLMRQSVDSELVDFVLKNYVASFGAHKEILYTAGENDDDLVFRFEDNNVWITEIVRSEDEMRDVSELLRRIIAGLVVQLDE